MQKMSSRMPCTHEPWVLWPAKNCTMCFMTPQKSHFQDTKMHKWTHTKVCSLEPRVLRLGKIGFSGLKYEENLLKLREVPMNSGLHHSAKIAFSCPQNAENELTRKYVPLNRLFNGSAEIDFSGRKVQKMSSHESRYTWTVGIMIRQKSHIKVAKKQKMGSHEARYPGNVGFTTRQKLHFQG